MPNERLRALLLERGVTPAKLAADLEVDPKTIERWIVAGRVPYRRHRYRVASFFKVDESYIWPGALDYEQVAAAAQSEIVAVYPHRWAGPRDTWEHFFAQAEQEIGAPAVKAALELRKRLPATKILLLGVLPSDRSAWITETTAQINRMLAKRYKDDPAVSYLDLTALFMRNGVLNRDLFLGLEDFESHFAMYPPGAFYLKHVDRFRDV